MTALRAIAALFARSYPTGGISRGVAFTTDAMKPSHGRRTWVKLWVNDWLEGTTRYQVDSAQRVFWVDLLAMAGRSRYGGVVCAGKDDDQWVGYPLKKFQGLIPEPIDVEATFELFKRTGKITMEVSGEGDRRLYTLFITNWVHYQSEYERKRSEKERRNKNIPSNVPSDVPTKSSGISHSVSLKSTSTEVEIDGDEERDGEKRRKTTASAAYLAIGFEQRFGQPRFQKIWEQEFAKEAEWLTIKMEATIQRCQKLKVGIPPQFYDAKRDVEAREDVEVKAKLKRTPL
jgi:hypothetical protein